MKGSVHRETLTVTASSPHRQWRLKAPRPPAHASCPHPVGPRPRPRHRGAEWSHVGPTEHARGSSSCGGQGCLQTRPGASDRALRCPPGVALATPEGPPGPKPRLCLTGTRSPGAISSAHPLSRAHLWSGPSVLGLVSRAHLWSGPTVPGPPVVWAQCPGPGVPGPPTCGLGHFDQASAEDALQPGLHVEVLGPARDRDEEVGHVQAPVLGHELVGHAGGGVLREPDVLQGSQETAGGAPGPWAPTRALRNPTSSHARRGTPQALGLGPASTVASPRQDSQRETGGGGGGRRGRWERRGRAASPPPSRPLGRLGAQRSPHSSSLSRQLLSLGPLVPIPTSPQKPCLPPAPLVWHWSAFPSPRPVPPPTWPAPLSWVPTPWLSCEASCPQMLPLGSALTLSPRVTEDPLSPIFLGNWLVSSSCRVRDQPAWRAAQRDRGLENAPNMMVPTQGSSGAGDPRILLVPPPRPRGQNLSNSQKLRARASPSWYKAQGFQNPITGLSGSTRPHRTVVSSSCDTGRLIKSR